jgi:hypothetical protein
VAAGRSCGRVAGSAATYAPGLSRRYTPGSQVRRARFAERWDCSKEYDPSDCSKEYDPSDLSEVPF